MTRFGYFPACEEFSPKELITGRRHRCVDGQLLDVPVDVGAGSGKDEGTDDV